MVKRINSSFPKDWHSATQAELKKNEHTDSETSPKLLHEIQTTENHNKTIALYDQ